MSQAMSDVSFSSGLGRHKFGNSTTQFSADGCLITSEEDFSRNHRTLPPRDSRSDNGGSDFRSLDPGRDRRRNYHDRYRRDEGRDEGREYGREFVTTPRDYHREPPRDYHREPSHDYGRDRDFHSGRRYGPPLDYTRDGRDWVKPNYDNFPREPSRGFGNGPDPVYGRTLPLPSHRDYGPPARRHDDYRPRGGRTHYDHSMPSNSEWRIPPYLGSSNYDKTGLIAKKNYAGRHGMMARKETKRKATRPISWFFLIVGVFLLACGLVNVLICTEYYYFCFFWVGVVALELGIVGLIHKGRYRNSCTNIYYISTGVLLMVVAMVATALVLRIYVPTVKYIASKKNLTEYVIEVSNLDRKPIITSINADTRVWLCLGIDSASLVLLMACYFSLYAAIKVGSRYWNTRHVVTKPVAPFCKPKLFNPFLEMIFGEALVFMGLLTVYICVETQWYKYWSPVWTGAFIIITGGVSSWAGKNPYRTMTSLLAVVFNFLGAAVTSVCIVMCVLGLKENIEFIIQVGTSTPAKTDPVYASLIIFVITITVALICFFYCLGLVVRFGYYMTRGAPGYDRETFTTESRSETTISTVRGRYGYDGRDPPLPTRANHKNGIFGRRAR